MTERNVPFLLNAAPAKTDAWTDRILWRLAGYFRRRRFSGFDRFLSGIESIVDFGGTTDIWVMLDRRNVEPRELQALSAVNLMGTATAPEALLFILEAIRESPDAED